MGKVQRKKGDQILSIALTLAEEEGWSGVTIEKIAKRVNLNESKLLESYPTTKHVVLALMKQVSVEVFDRLDPDDSSEPTKDIIHNALMSRVEVLSKNREAYKSILGSLFFNPRDAIFLYSEIMNIMARTLQIAGIKNTGLLGHLRKKALVAIYLSTLRVWISDDSPDCARTMSFLDKRLQDAEALEGIVQKLERASRVSRQEV
ncbi:MAG: hypothetical protein VX597_03600 [Pseudomonadota bacterium]|nr:hypothetical protein [Pseudomonadota bacterium]